MKKSLLGLMAGVLIAACLVAADYVQSAVAYVHSAAWRMSRSLMDGLAEFAPAPLLTLPKVQFAQAKAFVQRIVKRERPVLISNWRMCPST